MSEKTQIIITAKDETGAAINSAKRGIDSLSASAGSLRTAFSFLGSAGGLAGMLGGGALVATVKQAIDGLDALNQSAERLGVSASKLETLNFAGKLSGLADDDIEKALTKLSVKLEEAAAGSKEAIAWFEKLGVAWKDSAGNVKTADKAFEDVSEKISQMADGTGKVTTLVEGFGEKLGRKLAPALNGGANGLAAFRKEAEALGGGSYNLDELARQADEFNDNLDKLAFASKAAGRGLANELLPSLNDTASAMVAAAVEGNKLWAVLRGIAGIGKIPFDLVLGSSKPDLSVDTQLNDLKGKLARLEGADKSLGTGLISRLVYGSAEQREKDAAILRNQIATLEKYKDKLEFKPTPAEKPKPTSVGGATDKGGAAKSGGAARAQVDEAERLIASLNEQIALKNTDAESTDKMTAAEVQAVRVRYQLEAGTLKATEAQRAAINARLDDLVALEKTLAKQKEFNDALNRQEEANAKGRQAMVDATLAANQQAEAYGLSEATLSMMTKARLEDALAIANQTGGMEDQVTALEEELALREKLTAALEKSELARDLANTKSGKKAAEQAKIASYDVALAKGLENGGISKTQYDELIANIKSDVGELDEFAKQAARNIQDAFADFLFDPFAKGTKDMLASFNDMVRRMLAQAIAAQLAKALFGDGKGDSGYVGAAIKAIGIAAGFAEGGIMTSSGPLPLRKYAMGGIANTPQAAIFGEGSTPEAYVPLQDGRNIPVKLVGGQQSAPAAPAQNIRIVNAFDTSVVGDYMGSAAGERIILNAVQRNASAFRQAVA